MHWHNRTVIVAAAGTGGHIFSALAVAQCIHCHGGSIRWIGAPGGMETKLLEHYPFPVSTISFGGVLGHGLKRWLSLPPTLLRAIWQARRLLRSGGPQSRVVLAMGGYISAPVVLAAWTLNLPVVIHEQNARSGFANLLNARFATHICESFTDTFPKRRNLHTTGNPVRPEFKDEGYHPPARFTARRPFKLLVFGGSQGAAALNHVVPDTVKKLLQRDAYLSCTLQCGEQEYQRMTARIAAEKLDRHVKVTAFIHDMMDAYRNADVVIARSGASSISELMMVRRASILIPLPHATCDHQTLNAQYLHQSGAAWLVPQRQLNADTLATRLMQLYTQPQKIAAVCNNLPRTQSNAANEVATVCYQALTERGL